MYKNIFLYLLAAFLSNDVMTDIFFFLPFNVFFQTKGFMWNWLNVLCDTSLLLGKVPWLCDFEVCWYYRVWTWGVYREVTRYLRTQILTWSIVFNNCRTKMINTYIKRDRSCIRVQASYNTDIKLHGIILVYNQDQTGYSLTKYIKLTLCMEGRS